MKNHKPIFIFVILVTIFIALLSACNAPNQPKNDSPTAAAPINSSQEEPAKPAEDVQAPLEAPESGLTPEENANSGSHTYSFTTEIDCETKIPEPEKFLITFSESSVEINRIEPTAWKNQYEKVSNNTYFLNVEDGPEITIKFNLNGFLLHSTEMANECGNYIRTLIQ